MAARDRLPGHVPEVVIREIGSAQMERKAAQPVDGSSVIGYVSETTNLYDWTGIPDTPTGFPGYSFATLRITFTAERAEFPQYEPIIEIYRKNTSGQYVRFYLLDDAATTAKLSYQMRDGVRDIDKPHEAVTILDLTASNGTEVAVKALVHASDGCSITVERVA